VRHAAGRISPEGSITLLSGAAAWTPMRGGAITASTNGAVAALVRTLAVELAPVRVNAVSPGIIDTPTWNALPDAQRSAMFDRLAGALPVGRVGTAEDVAEAIMFLMGSGFTTGTVLHIEGGHGLAAP
jgi:NAD(P)-dependent dehydrogenase (short-subunit alcohol dehydrogenase family)